MVCESNDETNFLHKLVLIDAQVSKLRKAFANGSSVNKKLSKIQLSKMVQLEGVLSFGITSFLNSKKLFNSIENSIPKSVSDTLKDSIKDSFEEEVKNKCCPKSGKDRQNVFVNVVLNTLGQKNNKELSTI